MRSKNLHFEVFRNSIFKLMNYLFLTLYCFFVQQELKKNQVVNLVYTAISFTITCFPL